MTLHCQDQNLFEWLFLGVEALGLPVSRPVATTLPSSSMAAERTFQRTSYLVQALLIEMQFTMAQCRACNLSSAFGSLMNRLQN
jgi:hypothetical protein